MLTECDNRSKANRTLDALRRRICLTAPNTTLQLHENALAAEFEMSRTPIRQVLQRLAYERLVETRSGVGTIAPALREEHRARDIQTHAGLVRAVLEHKLGALSLLEQSNIQALSAAAEQSSALTAEMVFDVRVGLLTAVSDHIPDPLLQDAFHASFWRATRWRLNGCSSTQLESAESLISALKKIAIASKQGAASVFEALLELES